MIKLKLDNQEKSNAFMVDALPRTKKEMDDFIADELSLL
jgi:hypothetical protein